MATNRESLLRKLTGLLKRITDADDDYTVTADQRAALMELESLTWNYPTPQQARGCASSLTHGAKDDSDDSEDDDDDESYYMDIVPYDMTERLKEVNRALIEDPTPAECDRAITIRFREVIADYHSPRDDFPSDSDDGYGDSSDILYDAEEEEGEEGLTSLSAEAKEVLGGNVNVVDMMASSVLEDDGHGLTSQTHSKTLDIPKLQLEDQHEDASSFVDGELPEPAGSRYVLDEKPLLLLDDRSVSYTESLARDVESPEIEENLPDSKLEEAEEVQEVADLVTKGSVSLLEVSEKTYVERGPRSLGDMTTEDEIPANSSVNILSDNTCNDASDTISFHIPAKSESDFASFEYSDDFEDFQEEPGSTEKDNKKSEREEGPLASTPNNECPPKKLQTSVPDPAPLTKAAAPTEGLPPSRDSQKHSHKSKKDHVSRKVQSPPVERRRKNSSESAKTSPSETGRSPKPKRVGGGTPMIKPALLSSDKLNTIKHNESSRHKSRSTAHAPSASSSPLSSASSSSSHSSSSSSSTSSYSVSRARSRNQSSISGPVRPTAHRPSGSTTKESSRVGGSSPVRPPSSASHSGVPHTPPGQTLGGRLMPPARVRKAASASDLHNRVTDEVDDRRRQNDEVFQAWLRQKNKQAAQCKRQQQRPAGKRSAAEAAARRAQAEEAFQVWLSRKRDQLRLEKKLRGERRRLEDQSRYARTKNECEVAYKEWCRRKRDEVRMTARSGGAVPRSQSLERTWVQEKTRKLYTAYLNNH